MRRPIALVAAAMSMPLLASAPAAGGVELSGLALSLSVGVGDVCDGSSFSFLYTSGYRPYSRVAYGWDDWCDPWYTTYAPVTYAPGYWADPCFTAPACAPVVVYRPYSVYSYRPTYWYGACDPWYVPAYRHWGFPRYSSGLSFGYSSWGSSFFSFSFSFRNDDYWSGRSWRVSRPWWDCDPPARHHAGRDWDGRDGRGGDRHDRDWSRGRDRDDDRDRWAGREGGRGFDGRPSRVEHSMPPSADAGRGGRAMAPERREDLVRGGPHGRVTPAEPPTRGGSVGRPLAPERPAAKPIEPGTGGSRTLAPTGPRADGRNDGGREGRDGRDGFGGRDGRGPAAQPTVPDLRGKPASPAVVTPGAGGKPGAKPMAPERGARPDQGRPGAPSVGVGPKAPGVTPMPTPGVKPIAPERPAVTPGRDGMKGAPTRSMGPAPSVPTIKPGRVAEPATRPDVLNDRPTAPKAGPAPSRSLGERTAKPVVTPAPTPAPSRTFGPAPRSGTAKPIGPTPSQGRPVVQPSRSGGSAPKAISGSGATPRSVAPAPAPRSSGSTKAIGPTPSQGRSFVQPSRSSGSVPKAMSGSGSAPRKAASAPASRPSAAKSGGGSRPMSSGSKGK